MILDKTWLEKSLNTKEIESVDLKYKTALVEGTSKKEWALKALAFTDLTTLNGNDTPAVVDDLCQKAVNPFTADELKAIGVSDLHTAAVCVYPSRVADAKAALTKLNALAKVHIASVAAGFPSGQYPLKTRLDEIDYAIDQGANEIDIVLDRSLVLRGMWEELYSEVRAMRQRCGSKAHLKSILSVGECGSYENIYKAAMVCMIAGSDFIKTSTGKETVNATLPFGLVMIIAIKDFQAKTGRKVISIILLELLYDK